MISKCGTNYNYHYYILFQVGIAVKSPNNKWIEVDLPHLEFLIGVNARLIN